MTPAHLALLMVVNAVWGFNFIAGKLGTAVFGPLMFCTLRFAVVLLMLFPFLRIVRGQMRAILLIGMCLGAGHYSIMFYALYLGDNVSSIAIAASFLGVVVIGFEPVNSAQQGWALLTLVFEQSSFAQLADIPYWQYWSAVYSAVGATIIGHGSLYYLLQRYPVNSVAPFITLATLFAIAWGVWFVNDSLTPRIIAGGALTLLGVTIIAQRNAKTKTPSGVRVPR